jgi:hypothetical protein
MDQHGNSHGKPWLLPPWSLGLGEASGPAPSTKLKVPEHGGSVTNKRALFADASRMAKAALGFFFWRPENGQLVGSEGKDAESQTESANVRSGRSAAVGQREREGEREGLCDDVLSPSECLKNHPENKGL